MNAHALKHTHSEYSMIGEIGMMCFYCTIFGLGLLLLGLRNLWKINFNCSVRNGRNGRNDVITS